MKPMKIISFFTIFAYSFNVNHIFGRTIELTDWRFWVPVGMMFIGWLEGHFEKKN